MLGSQTPSTASASSSALACLDAFASHGTQDQEFDRAYGLLLDSTKNKQSVENLLTRLHWDGVELLETSDPRVKPLMIDAGYSDADLVNLNDLQGFYIPANLGAGISERKPTIVYSGRLSESQQAKVVQHEAAHHRLHKLLQRFATKGSILDPTILNRSSQETATDSDLELFHDLYRVFDEFAAYWTESNVVGSKPPTTFDVLSKVQLNYFAEFENVKEPVAFLFFLLSNERSRLTADLKLVDVIKFAASFSPHELARLYSEHYRSKSWRDYQSLFFANLSKSLAQAQALKVRSDFNANGSYSIFDMKTLRSESLLSALKRVAAKTRKSYTDHFKRKRPKATPKEALELIRAENRGKVEPEFMSLDAQKKIQPIVDHVTRIYNEAFPERKVDAPQYVEYRWMDRSTSGTRVEPWHVDGATATAIVVLEGRGPDILGTGTKAQQNQVYNLETATWENFFDTDSFQNVPTGTAVLFKGSDWHWNELSAEEREQADNLIATVHRTPLNLTGNRKILVIRF